MKLTLIKKIKLDLQKSMRFKMGDRVYHPRLSSKEGGTVNKLLPPVGYEIQDLGKPGIVSVLNDDPKLMSKEDKISILLKCIDLNKASTNIE